MNSTIEYILVPLEKSQIEGLLFFVAPHVSVIGSRFTEDGYDLFLEGPIDEIADFIVSAEEVVFSD